MIDQYFRRVQSTVSGILTATVAEYREQRLGPSRANLRFRLTWRSAALLEVSEALAYDGIALRWLAYRYHFQTPDLVLRYDNTPHHPDVPTYPEHRHWNQSVQGASRPDLVDLFAEIRGLTALW